MSFRDASVVIIETARTVVRAGLGLHELLKTPSVVSKSLTLLDSVSNTCLDNSSTRWPSKERVHHQRSRCTYRK